MAAAVTLHQRAGGVEEVQQGAVVLALRAGLAADHHLHAVEQLLHLRRCTGDEVPARSIGAQSFRERRQRGRCVLQRVDRHREEAHLPTHVLGQCRMHLGQLAHLQRAGAGASGEDEGTSSTWCRTVAAVSGWRCWSTSFRPCSAAG